jgi:RHS repeat-associated protein
MTPVLDAAGEMTTDETGLRYVFDGWGRIVAVKNSGGSTLESLTYDGLGRQSTSTAGGTITTFYYSNLGQAVEEWQGGSLQARNVWSPAYVNALIARDQSTLHNGTLDQRLYAVHDANWNVTALMATSGSIVERYAYLPFGLATFMNASWVGLSSSSYGAVYLFQGMRQDPISGFYQTPNRWYSPTLGSWTRNDPLGFTAGATNFFTFVGNNPLSFVDVLGLSPGHPAPFPTPIIPAPQYPNFVPNTVPENLNDPRLIMSLLWHWNNRLSDLRSRIRLLEGNVRLLQSALGQLYECLAKSTCPTDPLIKAALDKLKTDLNQISDQLTRDMNSVLTSLIQILSLIIDLPNEEADLPTFATFWEAIFKAWAAYSRVNNRIFGGDVDPLTGDPLPGPTTVERVNSDYNEILALESDIKNWCCKDCKIGLPEGGTFPFPPHFPPRDRGGIDPRIT